jgi:hypothetical protein
VYDEFGKMLKEAAVMYLYFMQLLGVWGNPQNCSHDSRSLGWEWKPDIRNSKQECQPLKHDWSQDYKNKINGQNQFCSPQSSAVTCVFSSNPRIGTSEGLFRTFGFHKWWRIEYLSERLLDSSFGIETGCELDGRVWFPAGARDFSLLHSDHNASGAHPVSYPVGTRRFFPGVKRLEHETDHSPPSSAEIKNGWVIPPLPHTSSWRGV